MTHRGKIVGWIVGVVVLVIMAPLALVPLVNLNFLRPTINDKVSAALDRSFRINGDLSADWRRPVGENGWRGWIPWLQVQARNITVGDPPGMAKRRNPERKMASLKGVTVAVAPLALFEGRLSIPRIGLAGLKAHLVRIDEGRNNWSLPQHGGSDKSSGWKLDIGDVTFDEGTVSYRDLPRDTKVTVAIRSLGKPLLDRSDGEHRADPSSGEHPSAEYVFSWKISGRYKGQSLEGQGKSGGIVSMESARNPFPLRADIHYDANHIELQGTLTNPLKLGALDLRLKLSGRNLGDLYPLTGVVLPDTAPYSTAGHLVAHLDRPAGALFHYQNFDGRIGESDLHGDLTYEARKPRPHLTAQLTSNELKFSDLAPLIGGNSQSGNPNPRPPPGKILPVDQFDTSHWSAMDADVKFNGERIERGNNLPLRDLYTHLTLNNGVLMLDPLRLGVAGGNLNTTVRLDGRQATLRGRVDMHARHLKLKQLVPNFASMKKALGELNGEATLSGEGNSVAALLGTSDGNVRLLVDHGVISHNLMELAGLNLGTYLVGKLFGDERVPINCMAADLHFDNGLARPRIFLIDTQDTLVTVSGGIDFANEKLNLTVKPNSKGPRLFTLRSPLYVRGSFENPSSGVKPGPLVERGAAAAVLGALAGPAALLALIAPSEEENNQCGSVLTKLKSRKK